MKTAVQVETASEPPLKSPAAVRVAADGKFLRAGDDGSGNDRFLIKGVTYGTFAPDADGYQFPNIAQVSEDFRLMAALGLNTVRVYTPPRRDLLDEAARHGLRVMVGLPWMQHVAFLDKPSIGRKIRKDLVRQVRELGDHPAVLLFAIGNEIPAGVVRWHGRLRIERFLRQLYHDAKAASPDSLFTYVNFPPTEFLDLSFFDICAFNVYLHRESDLRAYLARLQHIAGNRPLLLAEAGADSFREGEEGQATITATHVRVSFEEGACGAIAFAWTDEWWRGGHAVEDWAFGLVDRERQLKPAAASVAAAFADAPFPPALRRTWPRMSVVVCAYNAADTIDECLTALDQQTYPDYEVIVVNDGSRDNTSAIAKQHSRARVIDTPNAGLSAARNVGLAAATGDIVAYTDADTRADRDWLTYLVQPFMTLDVVGSGGPNIVPADDPPMAQSIARAPGGPTHVLLDDRIAEHVPGCNMAFRREALLAIGGFNATYLRAGDDVDVCWRLQGQGWRIGFSPSALVWHRHRSSVRAYWRQQVGYGEGERWLMAHHPDKFLDGRALWHGRIYSPLPFVRSLWGERINAGVWGTAAFPSVYRRDIHPFAFLPHSVRWQVLSIILTIGGVLTLVAGNHSWAAALLLAMGGVGLVTTVAKNIAYAWRSDVDRVPGSRMLCRARVAWLHFLQPFARAVGRWRGALSPPEVIRSTVQGPPQRAPFPSVREAARSLLLVAGGVSEDRYWTETYTTSERVLKALVDWLRRARAVRVIEIDEGWSADRDVSVLVGRWAWLDVRALVEDHGAGKSLLRVSTHLRPTLYGTVCAVLLATALLVAASAGVALRWPTVGAAAALFGVAAAAFTAYRTAQAAATLRRAVDAVARRSGLTAVASTTTRGPLMVPALMRTYGLRSTAIFLAIVLGIASGTFMLREAASAMVIGAQKGYGGDEGPAIQAWLDTPGGIAVSSRGDLYIADSNNHVIRRIDPANLITTVAGNHAAGWGFSGDFGSARDAQLNAPSDVALAPDGDLLIADAHNHRIRRVDRETGTVMTVAGSGEEGFDGDGGPATEAQLRMPSAVAVAQNGDVYIADTLNYRVRMVDHATGFIHTIAGRGVPRDPERVGDNGPATEAWLNMPSDVAIAPNGDLYIADMHNQRVRLVDARSRIITTIAGNGKWGHTGDGGPAVAATLAGPAGVAVVPDARGGVTLFIADHYNGRVRSVGPDGVIRDVSDGSRAAFVAPTRVAFAPDKGWLYVTDSSRDQVVVLNIAQRSPELLPRPRPAATPTGPAARLNP